LNADLPTEHWLSLALRAANMVAWSCALPAHDQLRYSETAAAFFGPQWRSPADAWRYTDPSDAARLRTVIEAAIAERGEYVDVVRYQPPGEPLRWLEIRGSVQCGPDGTPTGIVGVTWDITAHRRAEEAARVNEENFSRAFAASPEALSITRAADGLFLEANAAFLDLYGAKREQVIGRTVHDLGLFVDRRTRTEVVDEVLARGAAREAPVAVRRLDGEVRTVVASVVALEIGGERCLLTSQRDVTERQRTEQALRDSEQRLELALEGARMGTWRADYRTGEVVWDRQHCRLLGIEADLPVTAARGAWAEAMHPDDREAVVAELQAAQRAGRPYAVECRIRRADTGEERWIAAYGRFATEPDGTPVSGVGFAFDITDRKRMEEALRTADRRKDEFLATLAHELRNPLAPIRYSARLLRADAPAAALTTAREMIERQTTHMARLLDDLLDMSRITRDVIELRQETLDLRRTIEEVLTATRPLFEASQHRLVVSMPGEAVWVVGDRTRLAQIVDNLAQNAAKYTNPGGRVEVALEAEKGRVLLRVSDSGVGIPPARLPEVFELFSQVHRGEHGRRSGLGIGLAVVKRLVELHGGSIAAHSAGEGLGSTFEVVLPEAAAPASGTVPGRVVSLYGERPRVLLVDDNEDAVDSLSTLLRLEGYPVHVAHDGPAALVLAETVRPEVVVLDIGLPGMSGYEVARALRRQPWGTHLHLIAATGWGQSEDRRRSRDAGFDVHLTKPVDPDELLTLLSRLPRQPVASGGEPAA
jgi:PAS domain S-box-containing protein